MTLNIFFPNKYHVTLLYLTMLYALYYIFNVFNINIYYYSENLFKISDARNISEGWKNKVSTLLKELGVQNNDNNFMNKGINNIIIVNSLRTAISQCLACLKHVVENKRFLFPIEKFIYFLINFLS